MMDTAMETVPTALPTTDIAMAAGTMGKAISTAVSLGAIREAEEHNKYTNVGYYTAKVTSGKSMFSRVAFESQSYSNFSI